MKSISNNTLVALLAVALVVSVSASLYSLTEVSELGGGFDMLTSAAVADVPSDAGFDDQQIDQEEELIEETEEDPQEDDASNEELLE